MITVIPDYCKKIEGQMIFLGYSTEKLSRRSGYSKTTIDKILKGENVSLKAFCEVLQVLELELTVRGRK